ncbi:uncharacterized protein DMAD_02294 [Drosophila madeirensis]|uniref:C2H2-type domain-containing protein n=1 Tax=Drosophila madeirensis TaxID=30013 RepID=A0AAU9G5Y2_DROMD
MGRPRTIDVTNLVVEYPDKNICRCVLCDRTLSGCLRSNIKRHYQRLHPEVVLPRPQGKGAPVETKDKGTPVEAKKTVTRVRRMGRVPLVDTLTLAKLLPDGKHCRCRICDKTLIYVSANVRRHYKNYHPQYIPDQTVAHPPAENRKHLRRSQTKSSPGLDPAKAKSSTKESGDEEEDHPSGQLSNEHFDSIFIGKTEVQEVEEDEELSDDQLVDADEMRFSEALNQTVPAISAPLSMRNSPSAPTSSSSFSIGATTTLSGDDASYLQYLGNKFGKYSARTKHTVQFQINRILYRADIGCFDKTEAKKLNESEKV